MKGAERIVCGAAAPRLGENHALIVDRVHQLISRLQVQGVGHSTIVGALATRLRGLAPVRREIIDSIGRG